MAFQAGGAHALDRALEAIAYAWTEMTRTPATALWEKPGPRRAARAMEKTFTVVPRGVALVIGCNTFPTWNSWPGLFASLVTGNPVVVKPHPARGAAARDHRAGLPGGAGRGRLRPEPGHAGRRGARRQAGRDAGGAARGEADRLHRRQRVRRLARGATPARPSVFTEKAGVNTVVVDSTDDFAGDVPEPRVLVLALHRPDVHRPAERLPAGRRHRHRRGPQVRRPRWRRASRRRSASCSATTPGRSSCSAASSTTACSSRLDAAPAQRRGAGRVARRSPTRRTPTRRSARPRCSRLTAADSDVYERSASARSPT